MVNGGWNQRDRLGSAKAEMIDSTAVQMKARRRRLADAYAFSKKLLMSKPVPPVTRDRSTVTPNPAAAPVAIT